MKQVPQETTKKIIDLYQKGKGLRDVGVCVDLSPQIVRRTLIDNGIQIRDAGIPATFNRSMSRRTTKVSKRGSGTPQPAA
jgi:hypothetical protein